MPGQESPSGLSPLWDSINFNIDIETCEIRVKNNVQLIGAGDRPSGKTEGGVYILGSFLKDQISPCLVCL